eukprot:TRINITY_DN9225_c0_g3_i2.p1 TRINITY_DN9225_c0_g3~~TRINITY_DN9225_c0_g3_i2.p1  ORF type:complete len:575 (+),score=72.54 TRINITY_DN9225_c0_g3_i2:169-1725(+)
MYYFDYGTCTFSLNNLPLNRYCDDEFCNWNTCSNLSLQECERLCLSPRNLFFCGLCEDDVHCEDLGNSSLMLDTQATCSASILCILNNNTRILTKSEEECVQIMSCDSGCPNCTQEQCLKDYTCTDSTDLIHGIWTGNRANRPICSYLVVFSKPWDQSTKRLGLFNCSITSLTAIFSCLDLTFSIKPEDCNPTALSALLYGEVKSAKLLMPATTQEECENISVCWGPVNSRFPGIDDDLLYVPKEACNNPKWRYDTLWKWINKHTWLGGRPRHPVWTERKYGKRYVDGLIFDFATFGSLYSRASYKRYDQYLQSFLFCQHSRENSLLNTLVCSCIEGKSGNTCGDLENSTISDIGTYCGGYSVTLASPPFEMRFMANSTNDNTCHTFYFHSVSITLYLGSGNKPHLTSVIINFSENYRWGLRNNNSALWGKVLTDGIYIYTSNSTHVQYFYNVTFTVTKFTERWYPEIADYPILDLAYSLPCVQFHIFSPQYHHHVVCWNTRSPFDCQHLEVLHFSFQ